MIYIIIFILACWFVVSWSDLYLYQRRLNGIPLRIHVNGIRGKSSVVRYASSVLRSHNYKTLAKTTGTAPRIIGFNGEEIALKRAGVPNIFEQLLLMKHFISLKPQAVVIECMATNPNYSEWLEHKVMKSHIYIMTNVRIDHQDQLGYTIEEIAKSLAYSLPYNSSVITGETNSKVLEIFEDVCKSRNSRLICPCVDNSLAIKSLRTDNFSHTPIMENIQVCLALASLLNIPSEQAISAMANTNPDPGHFTIKTIFVNGIEIAWCNLFAVNDKESFLEWAQLLISVHKTFEPVVILNNRKDRVDRVPVFVDCIKVLKLRQVVTMGDCEVMVAAQLGGQVTCLKLGNSSLFANSSGHDLIRRIVFHFNAPKILLIGAVNIHTHQADNLLSYLESYRTSAYDAFHEDFY